MNLGQGGSAETSGFLLRPYVFVLRLTERCGVGCSHCSISAVKQGNDLSRATLEQAIPEIAASGVERIHLTGGEPLLFEGIAQIVRTARHCDLVIGATTSTFSTPGENTIEILDDLVEADISYLMLSHDDQHARRIPQDHFVDFIEAAASHGVEVSVFTVQSPESHVTVERIRAECESRGVDVKQIDWFASEVNTVGREGRDAPNENTEKNAVASEKQYPRCPIVLSAPTLNPDGSVSLCNCARFKTPKFTIGNYHRQSIAEILEAMVQDPTYRLLAKFGPQKLLSILGLPVELDMCRSCERVLQACEDDNFLEWIENTAAKEDLDKIPVDYQALPNSYKKHLEVFGEPIS